MSTDDTTSTAPTEEPTVEEGRDVKIRVENVTKRFGRIVALDDVSLDIYENEIFALVGDNGAGKSTLMHVLNGVHEADGGVVYLDGEPVDFDSPSDAREWGIETVYQDLALMDDLDVATNVFAGKFPTVGIGPLQFIDWDGVYERAGEIVHEQLGRDIDLQTEVQFLSGGERQLVAIGRTLAFDPDVLILDEPTSALSVEAARLVHETIRRLQEQGMTIVIVSHNIEDVLELADRVGILFQGSLIDVDEADELDLETVTDLMVGRENHREETDP